MILLEKWQVVYCHGICILCQMQVLIVAGGGSDVNSTEKLVIGEDVMWSLVGPLPKVIYMATSLNIDNKLYFLGEFGTSLGGKSDYKAPNYVTRRCIELFPTLYLGRRYIKTSYPEQRRNTSESAGVMHTAL
jgi:hypothetical protein